MEWKAFLIKYAEIGTKGKNRILFEEALMNRIREVLEPVGAFTVSREAGRIFAEAEGSYDFDEAVAALRTVFGIAGICPMVVDEDDSWDHLVRMVCDYVDSRYPDKHKTFKVIARRAKKSYPIESMQINSDLGEQLLLRFPELKVDVHNPQISLHLEIRHRVYLYSEILPGPGGMPVGTNGKAMLLLSGGIDSPVAGYMVAKRGVLLEAVYFHAPPYTSERAKQKVLDLAGIVARYSGAIRLHIVNFTDIQLAIYEKCPHDELTIIMRRYMMKIAEHLAAENGCLALVTGESLGQVASQTIQSLAVTNEVCDMPVFRPCIGMDKQEIVDISEKIGTYETSIQPYEDCCTIFVAKHPVTKPNLRIIRRSESRLDDVIDGLMEQALSGVETVVCRGK